MELFWKNGTVSLSQSKYIDHILKRFRMSGCRPKNTPMETNLRIEENFDDSLTTKKPFRELKGSLWYLANMTWPDIIYAASFSSQFRKRPTDMMYSYAK